MAAETRRITGNRMGGQRLDDKAFRKRPPGGEADTCLPDARSYDDGISTERYAKEERRRRRRCSRLLPEGSNRDGR